MADKTMSPPTVADLEASAIELEQMGLIRKAGLNAHGAVIWQLIPPDEWSAETRALAVPRGRGRRRRGAK